MTPSIPLSIPLSILLCSVLSIGCVGTRYAPRRSTPEQILPTATDHGRASTAPTDVPVVIDVVDGVTSVRRVTGVRDVARESSLTVPTYEVEREYRCVRGTCGFVDVAYSGTRTVTRRWTESVRSYEPVCSSTPCVADLPPGEHTLVFAGATGESDAVVTVSGPALAVRHALTLREPGTDVWAGTATFWVIGGLAALIGPLMATYEQSSLGADREPIGWGVTGAGVGLLVLGTVILAFNRETVVTPGATASWTIEP